MVDCTREQQIERLTRRNNLTREEALKRIEAQPPQAEKLARADQVIDNSQSAEQTVTTVHAMWGELTRRRTA